ncbi:CPBP family intramembrane glutamic endopeptidase [Shivajiella indica]|uniref:CPBP family intramembrane glutamic endopeptidase n=1 Tax=Shivajiella indica TaxID=872115 RepID=A0ABW5B4N5_9BACT
MQIYKTKAPIASRRSWFLSLIIVLLITVGVMILLQGLGLMLVPPIFNISLDEMLALFTSPSDFPNAKYAMYFVQGLGSGLSFIIASLIIAKLIDKADFGIEQQIDRFKFNGFLILLLIMFGSLLFNSLIIDWNANMHLPESMGKLEEFFKRTEDERMVMTKFLTDFENPFEFVVAVLVIGIFAGVGEELFFRGVVQPKMLIYTQNGHLAVWITAFIFSAIHIQFYGFFPRMLLGAIFGYLYLYSGSLFYPIIAHILNNTFTVVLLYLSKLGKIEFDIDQTGQVSLPYAIIGLFVLLLGMKVFKEKGKKYKLDEELEESL